MSMVINAGTLSNDGRASNNAFSRLVPQPPAPITRSVGCLVSSSCISGEKVQLPLCCHRSVCKDFEQCLTLQSVTNSSAIRQVFFRVSNVTHTLQCMLMWLPSSLKGSLGDVACLGAAAMSLILNSFQEWRKDSKCKRWSFGWEDHR